MTSAISAAMKQPTDQPAPVPPGGFPADWLELAPELEAAESDVLILKRQWGAFYGTELDLQLRRRGVKTIVLGGIATNLGVESTVRSAWEHNYDLVLAEDATSGVSTEHHRSSMENIMPRLGLVRGTAEILAAL
jgi:nicotinamidase-related amidase